MMPTEEELNDLLKSWTVPQTPASLEGRLRSAYRDRSTPGKWSRWVAGLSPATGLVAGMSAGALVFLLVIAEAFPQTVTGLSGTTFPITADFEEIAYNANGTSVVLERFTSAGGGLVLSSEFPGDPLRTAQQRILDPLSLFLFRLAAPIRNRQGARFARLIANNPLLAERVAERQRTCSEPGSPWTVVGTQTILNYATTGIQKVWMEEGKPVRLTQWSAPDLHCFTLKSTTEKTFDGELRPAFEQRALKVTISAPATTPDRPSR